MVKIHLKSGNESVFLYDTTTSIEIIDLLSDVIKIYNFRTKIENLCSEIEYLSNHGAVKPLNTQECIEERLSVIYLSEESYDKYEPAGGFIICEDPLGIRCGKSPVQSMKENLLKCIAEAKATISKAQIDGDICLTVSIIVDVLESLKRAVFYVYPNGLPTHDPVQKQMENTEDFENLDIFVPDDAELWWASKILQPNKKLADYVGKNEKTKIIVKIQKKGQGAPPKEQFLSEEDKKQMLLHYYKRQEELNVLADDDDSSYLDNKWADNHQLKHSFLGLKDVQFKPK